jgi:uncharacterized membrane protein YkoI
LLVAFSAGLAIAAATASLAKPVSAQDGGKRQQQAGAKREAREQEREQARAAAEAAKAKLHAERLASFMKLYPAAKSTLAAAVETAEKQTKGRAYDVFFRLDTDGNLALSVGVVANDRFYVVPIDPQTGEGYAAVEETDPDPDLGEPDDDDDD